MGVPYLTSLLYHINLKLAEMLQLRENGSECDMPIAIKVDGISPS
jgi:hypothetical protein